MGIDLSLIKSGDPDIQADAADTKTGTTYAIMGEDSDTVADNWNKILLPMDHVDNPKGYHFKKMKRQGKVKKLWPFGKEEHDQKIALYDNKDRPVSFKDLELFKTNPLDETHYGGDYINYPTVSFRTGDSMGKQKDTYNEILKTLRGKGIDLFDNDGL